VRSCAAAYASSALSGAQSSRQPHTSERLLFKSSRESSAVVCGSVRIQRPFWRAEKSAAAHDRTPTMQIKKAEHCRRVLQRTHPARFRVRRAVGSRTRANSSSAVMAAMRLRRRTHWSTARRERGAGRSTTVWQTTSERRPEVPMAAFEPPQISTRVDMTGVRLHSTALHIVHCAIVDKSDLIETVAPSTRRSHSSSSPPSSSHAPKRTHR